MSAASNRFWCPKCNEARQVWMNKLLPMREKKPNFQFTFVSVPVCGEGHRLERLCVSCEAAPALPDFDECETCVPDEEKPLEHRIEEAEQNFDLYPLELVR